MSARVHSESARRVSDCVTALLRKQPFFGSLALRLPIRADASRETVTSDGREIRYSPRWIDDEPDGAAAAEPEQAGDAADASGPEPVAGAQTAGAAANGNGHAEPAAPETGLSGADDGNDAGDDGQVAGTVDTAIPEDAAAAAEGMPPAHINGRDAAPDPLEIPEFLRRVH